MIVAGIVRRSLRAHGGAAFVVVWRWHLFAVDLKAQGRWEVRARVAALGIPLLIGGVLLAAAFDVRLAYE